MIVCPPEVKGFTYGTYGRNTEMIYYKLYTYINGYIETKGGVPYNGLYGEAPPERGTFFRLQVYKRISQVEVYKRVGKSVI